MRVCGKSLIPGRPYRNVKCCLPATIEEDGRWWCHRHAPMALYLKEVEAAKDRMRFHYVCWNLADKLPQIDERWLFADPDNPENLVGRDEVKMRRSIMKEIATFLKRPDVVAMVRSQARKNAKVKAMKKKSRAKK